MNWGAYEMFTVLSGIVMVGIALVPSLSGSERVWAVLGGGIYVANQSSGTYYFPVYIFVLPVIGVVYACRSLFAPPAAPIVLPPRSADPGRYVGGLFGQDQNLGEARAERRFCGSCGAATTLDAAFCGQCGQQSSPSAPIPLPPGVAADAGWYPDPVPSATFRRRRWDGASWTTATDPGSPVDIPLTVLANYPGPAVANPARFATPLRRETRAPATAATATQ